MRTLWIHAGHGKTGSSYLQTQFARHQKTMETAGIAYPGNPRVLRNAARGDTTSGTGGDAELVARIATVPDHLDVLISYEGFFGSLVNDPLPEMTRWRHWMRKYGFDQIKVLLFIRNPIGHMGSSYLQAVRYNAECKTLDVFAERYGVPVQVQRVLKALGTVDWIDTTVLNYSNVRGALWEETAIWLDLPDKAPLDSTAITVNRALTRGELHLLLWMNRLAPLLSQVMAQESLRMFPNVTTGKPMVPPIGTQEKVMTKNRQAMAAVNAMIPDAQAYTEDFATPTRFSASLGDLALSAGRLLAGVLGFALLRMPRVVISKLIAKTR